MGADQGDEPAEPWGLAWEPGEAVLQGFVGATIFQRLVRAGGQVAAVDGSDDDLAIFATGGGAQWKLAGEGLDFGFEGMLSLAGRADFETVAAAGGGAVLELDVDLFLLDVYGGPFLSLPLAERLRAYAAAGPMLQWGSWQQEGPFDESFGDHEHGEGFGVGLYARTGLELFVEPRLRVGLGVRWSESELDLDGGLGDLELESLQWALTVTTGP